MLLHRSITKPKTINKRGCQTKRAIICISFSFLPYRKGTPSPLFETNTCNHASFDKSPIFLWSKMWTDHVECNKQKPHELIAEEDESLVRKQYFPSKATTKSFCNQIGAHRRWGNTNLTEGRSNVENNWRLTAKAWYEQELVALLRCHRRWC